MQDASAPGNTLFLSAKDIEGIIMKQLIPSTSLISFVPQQIEIPYSKLQKKKLPVYFDGVIRTELGFLVSGEIVLTPSGVDVFAADVVLDSLTSVRTVYTEINKANKTLTRKLKLQKTEGVRFVPQEVSVTIPIEEYTEKTLEIPLVCRDVPQGYTVRMFPSVVRLSCNVPLSRFRDLSGEDFSVEALLVHPEQNVSGMLPVRLTKKPDWVDRVALSQDSVEFILESRADD
jgi:YbbR domain-containing protein